MVSLGGINRLSPERQRGMYTKYSDRYAWTISVDPDPTSRSAAIDQALTVCYLSSSFFFTKNDVFCLIRMKRDSVSLCLV